MANIQIVRLVSAANSTNSTLITAKPAFLVGFTGLTAAAAVRYLKFYDQATAPTVGTDTPRLTEALQQSARFFNMFINPIYFGVGIGFGIVNNAADNDSTAPTAADIVGLNIHWTYSLN